MYKNIFLLFIPLYLALLFLISCSPGKTTNTISTDSLSIARGQSLFQGNCSVCHGFRQNGIGPDLSGITENDSLNWLKQFIREPKILIESGDEQAKKLLAEYHTVMPSFTGFKDEEVDQLIAYLHTQKKINK